MIDVDKLDLSKECVLKLKDDYDEKYKDDGKHIDYFGDFNDLKEIRFRCFSICIYQKRWFDLSDNV